MSGGERLLLTPLEKASFAFILLPEAMDFCLVLEARGFSALPTGASDFALQEKALGRR